MIFLNYTKKEKFLLLTILEIHVPYLYIFFRRIACVLTKNLFVCE